MAVPIRASVCEFLRHLGFDVTDTHGYVTARRDALGRRICYVVRFEDRASLSQLPTPSVYAKRFLNSTGGVGDQQDNWVVVAKDATESGQRFRDLKRALGDTGVKIGTLPEFLDSFVPRDAISQYLGRRTDTILHNVGYVPQHLAGASEERLPAVETVDAWIRGRHSAPLGLIHAPAGHGKTIFVERLAKELIRSARSDSLLPVPLLVKFADHRDVDTVEGLLMHALADVGRGDVTVPALKDLIRAGRVVLIFDGLDELSEEVGERIDLQNIRSLAELIRRDSDGKVLITARSTFLDTGRSVAEILSGRHQGWELLPFDETDQREFLERNPPEDLSGSDVGRHRDRVMSFLGQNPEIQNLATSPFLLKQVSLAVSMDQARLPKNLADAYTSFLKSLCERELVRQQHSIAADRQMRFLGRLAHEMVYEQAYAYSPDLFDLIIRDEFSDDIERAKDREARGQALVRKLTNHAAFVPEAPAIDGGSDIQFVHETLRDFGAAHYLYGLIEQPDSDVKLQRSALSHRSLPEGVVLFMRDLLEARELGALAQLIHRTPTPIDNQNLFQIAAVSAIENAMILAFATRRCRGLNLARVVVDGANLSNFVFEGCELNGAVFVSCDLTECDLTTTRLEGASFRDCVLEGTRFDIAHGVARVDDVTPTESADSAAVTVALVQRGAFVGGKGKPVPKKAAAAELTGRELVVHVLNKFYAGARPESARRRSRYSDVLDRGRPGEDRVAIRSIVIPELCKADIITGQQKSAREVMMVTSNANSEVVNFLFRGAVSARMRDVLKAVDNRLN